jgi:polysaccharide export outer membrane protein
MTAQELKDVITRELEEYISHPDVTVIVAQTGSKRVYVLGEVVRSGPIGLTTQMRITDAISVAGGFGPFADKGDVKLIRRTPDGEQEFEFNYDAYVAGRAPGTNLVLLPGDTIVVPD